MSTDPTGRIVLVTGAASGLGHAFARLFRGDGASVAGCDMSGRLTESEQVCDLARECDVTDPAQVTELVDAVVERFGRLDALVANAGIARTGPLEDVSWKDVEDVVRVNLFGVLHCLRAVLPVMQAQSYGRIVIVASRNGEFCPPGTIGYNVSKAGVVIAARTLAGELGDRDILVNCMIPGPTLTPMFPRGTRSPDEAYPTVRMLATLPAGGPTGRVFFDLEEYDFFSLFTAETANRKKRATQ